MEKRQKICKVHGELPEDKIWISKCNNKNGKTYIYYTCAICRKSRQYKTKDEIKINIERGLNRCAGCDQDISINNFSELELKRKPSYCRECIQESNKKRWLERRCRADSILFKLTNFDYQEKLKEQNFVCEICKKPESRIHFKTKLPTRLCIDHHHKTGMVRGLLCTKCNLVIGSCNESIDQLMNAIDYLNKYNYQEIKND